MTRFLLLLLLAIPGTVRGEPLWGVVIEPAPVFSTPAFGAFFSGEDASRKGRDRCGQIRELEFVALPGTAVAIAGETVRDGMTVARITTADYPDTGGKSLYVDARFLEKRQARPPERPRRPPGREETVRKLLSAEGLPYVWGGNVRTGIPALRPRTPAPRKDGPAPLAGVDCSGLLYEATGGFTPRNSSELVAFGRGVPVAGRSAAEIAPLLKPLDLIVWKGHVIIVLDGTRSIESRLDCGNPRSGVVIRDLAGRLREVLRTRKAAPGEAPPGDGEFVVRRWLE